MPDVVHDGVMIEKPVPATTIRLRKADRMRIKQLIKEGLAINTADAIRVALIRATSKS